MKKKWGRSETKSEILRIIIIQYRHCRRRKQAAQAEGTGAEENDGLSRKDPGGARQTPVARGRPRRREADPDGANKFRRCEADPGGAEVGEQWRGTGAGRRASLRAGERPERNSRRRKLDRTHHI